MTILHLLLFARVLYSCVDKLREKWTGWSAVAFNTEIDLLLGVYVVDKNNLKFGNVTLSFGRRILAEFFDVILLVNFTKMNATCALPVQSCLLKAHHFHPPIE